MMKYIEWEDYFRQGITVVRNIPPQITSYKRNDCIFIDDLFQHICFSERFNIAPKFIDKGIHKANRLWRYYTFKELPGAVIFLGAK